MPIWQNLRDVDVESPTLVLSGERDLEGHALRAKRKGLREPRVFEPKGKGDSVSIPMLQTVKFHSNLIVFLINASRGAFRDHDCTPRGDHGTQTFVPKPRKEVWNCYPSHHPYTPTPGHTRTRITVRITHDVQGPR